VHQNEFEEDLSSANLWKKRRRQYTLWLGHCPPGFFRGGGAENLFTNLRLSRLIPFLLIALECSGRWIRSEAFTVAKTNKNLLGLSAVSVC
jgi:hypothetical protein